MKSKWIEYKGRRILFADYSDYGDDLDGLKQEVDDSDRLLMKEPKRSVRCVVDVTNTVGTKEAVELFKMSSKRTEPYVL